jgi:hypothetical protein
MLLQNSVKKTTTGAITMASKVEPKLVFTATIEGAVESTLIVSVTKHCSDYFYAEEMCGLFLSFARSVNPMVPINIYVNDKLPAQPCGITTGAEA